MMKDKIFYVLSDNPERVKIKCELRRASINFYNEEETCSLIKKLGHYRKSQAKNSFFFKVKKSLKL